MLDKPTTRPLGEIIRPSTGDLDKISNAVTQTYDQIAEVYSQRHFDDFVLNDALESFIQLLKRRHEHITPQVLDIGCGPGVEVLYMATRGFTVTGIDASRKMIQLAKQTAAKRTSCSFTRMKMHALRFPDATFDAIWCSRALIHVPQALIVDLLTSWKRVLKAEGILGVSVIIGERGGWGPEDYAPEYQMFNRYFAEGELEDALDAAGFTFFGRSTTIDHRDSNNPTNLFLLAQKRATHVTLPLHFPVSTLEETTNEEDKSKVDLQQMIVAHLRAGVLTPREQVNLCVLYDQLAQREKANTEQYKLAAQKLKLHLQTPHTLCSDDFDVWFAFGQLHLKLTHFHRAVACLEKALALRPADIPTLMRLAYSYEGLEQFGKAIELAHQVERRIERDDADDETKADLYHALGHFYVGRSHIGHEQVSVHDREIGEDYMARACSTGKKGIGYLGCLGSIYNEAKRYSETIRLLTETMSTRQLHEDEELYNALYFYRGEAFMGMDRYENAWADFERVAAHAREKHDFDSLALVRLYQIRMNLKQKSVYELKLDDIGTFLENLLEYEPSPYMIKSFKRDREQLIGILNALYLLKQCLDEQEPPTDFYIRLGMAVEYMEHVYEGEQKSGLDWLVLADNPGKIRGQISQFPGLPHLYGFNEVENAITERDIGRYRVWGVLLLEEKQDLAAFARISFLIGRFYREGYIIYIYDPNKVLPGMMYTALEYFFVESIEDVKSLSYACLLYNEVRNYLSSTITPLGMAPLGVTPSLLATQVDTIALLPSQGGNCS